MEALREITGAAGRLEARLDEPPDGRSVNADWLVESGREAGLRAAVVFGHPHPLWGGTMHTKAVYHAARALTRIGCTVLRFNFRGSGASEGVFTDGPGELEDFRAGVDFMAARYPTAPLWAAGFSFGAWVAMAAGSANARVTTLIGLAAPLEHYDFEAVGRSEKAKLFIHGERDEVCPLKVVREFYARAAEPKELAVVDGADHLFDGKIGELGDAVEELLGDWS